jgi:hypothetical protein
LLVTVKKSTNCLKRFKSLALSSSYLLQKDRVLALSQVPDDASKDTVAESTSLCGSRKVIIRKQGEKDLWIEVWTPELNGGLLHSCKISDKCSKVYADVVFGTIAWSPDLTKVAFVGEVPAPASYKNPWDLPKPKPDEEKKPEDEEHWQEEKYSYEEEFGELLVGKKTPAIFVYNLVENEF